MTSSEVSVYYRLRRGIQVNCISMEIRQCHIVSKEWLLFLVPLLFCSMRSHFMPVFFCFGLLEVQEKHTKTGMSEISLSVH